jgi:hypothetical protein
MTGSGCLSGLSLWWIITIKLIHVWMPRQTFLGDRCVGALIGDWLCLCDGFFRGGCCGLHGGSFGGFGGGGFGGFGGGGFGSFGGFDGGGFDSFGFSCLSCTTFG